MIHFKTLLRPLSQKKTKLKTFGLKFVKIDLRPSFKTCVGTPNRDTLKISSSSFYIFEIIINSQIFYLGTDIDTDMYMYMKKVCSWHKITIMNGLKL